jgi:trans-aconitate 2-methyltransferase
MWDPQTYLRFGDERSRPFVDLLARVDIPAPANVVDLGCGPGTLTVHLADRWPSAAVRGLDSSDEMIKSAQALGSTVRFDVADVRDWHAGADDDVVIANAVLQWLPDHDDLLRRWIGELRPGAVLAFQVPGNFDAPSHVAIRTVAAQTRWADRVPDVLRGGDAVLDPVSYARLLTGLDCAVDAWETTYLHLLPVTGPEHPVLGWVKGTALRPVREILDDADWTAFTSALTSELDAVYPVQSGQVYFPFRRIFAVAAVGGNLARAEA